LKNIINFNESQKPVVLASTYHMNYKTEDGTTHQIELTGDETFTTACPVCGREHTLEFDDFIIVMTDGCVQGVSVFCPACSKKRGD